jgi:hypothetical protein
MSMTALISPLLHPMVEGLTLACCSTGLAMSELLISALGRITAVTCVSSHGANDGRPKRAGAGALRVSESLEGKPYGLHFRGGQTVLGPAS